MQHGLQQGRLARVDRQYEQLKALERLRDQQLQRLIDRQRQRLVAARADRIQLESIIDDLSEAHAAVKHSRFKLNELCQP